MSKMPQETIQTRLDLHGLPLGLPLGLPSATPCRQARRGANSDHRWLQSVQDVGTVGKRKLGEISSGWPGMRPESATCKDVYQRHSMRGDLQA